MKKAILAVAVLICSAVFFVACGGGGGSNPSTDPSTNPPINPLTNSPTNLPITDPIAADKALANQLLQDYIARNSTIAQEAFTKAETKIRFDLMRNGMTCGSLHRDSMMYEVNDHVSANLTGVAQYASALAAAHYIDDAAFKQLFAQLKNDEIAFYQNFSFINCPGTGINFVEDSVTVINRIYNNPNIPWLIP